MPATSEDYTKIEALRKKQAESTRAYGQLVGTSQTFADEVMNRVRAARADRGVGRLAADIGETTGQLVSEPAKMRGRLAEVNPLQTDVLTARQRAQTLGTLSTLAQVGEERTGTITDILGAGTNRLLSEANMRKAEADAARQEAESMIETIQLKEQQAKNAFDQWYKVQTLQGGGTGEEEARLKYLTSQYKPSAGQEDLANKATVGLSLIENVRGAIKNNPNALRESTSFWSFLNPEARALKKNLEFISDTVTRIQTGAALNKEEQVFYNSFVNNPIEAVLGYTGGTEEAMRILEKVFGLAVEQAKNPYLEQLERRYSGQYGWGADDFTPD